MQFLLKIKESDLIKFKKDITEDESKVFKTSKSFDKLINENFKLGIKKKTSNAKLRLLIETNLLDIPVKSLDYYLKKLTLIIPAITNNLNTEAQSLSYIRTLIRKKYGLESKQFQIAVKNLLFKNNKERVKNSRRSLFEKHNEKVLNINMSLVIDVINKTRDSDDWNERAIFVQLATGSRFIEVIKLSEYSEAETKNEIKITGFAKTLLGKNPIKEITKPILYATSDEIIKSVKFVRSSIPDMSSDNKKLTNVLSKTVIIRIRRLFGSKLKTHDLRKIYGNASFHIFARKNRISLNAWLNNVLGHSKNNVATSLHYSTVNIDFDDEKAL